MASGTPASRAMASRCRTRFVEPPVAAPAAIAFSNASRQTPLQKLHRQLARRDADLILTPVRGGGAGRAHRREPEELEDHRHSVRGELPAAGPGAGASMILYLLQVLIAHAARRVGTDGLEDLLDRHVAALEAPRRYGAAVDDTARNAEPHVSHRGPRKRLIAADDGDDGVEHVAAPDQLD